MKIVMRIAFGTLFCFLVQFAFAQNTVCYAITIENDTIKGIYQHFKKDELKLWNLAQTEQIVIPADSLKAYILHEMQKDPVIYEPVSRSSAILPAESFSLVGMFKKDTKTVPMVRLYQGKFSLYRYRHIVDASTPAPSGFGMMAGSRTESAYYITYDKKSFTRIDNLKALKLTFKDCPEVVAKIGTKGYNKFKKHVEKIIDEYNDCQR